ncbi:hypothetical protein HW49_05445 [Porphyromonadaceae bacterium COT-184 OH4590]|nr:hypothetical protein HW49_05445 [Porphyromonadaceae bacterium COT-184 OH4590]
MKFLKRLVVIVLLAIGTQAWAQTTESPSGNIMMSHAIILEGDTVPYFVLPIYYCYPPLKFKNKKEENFYWRTVRDVKKVLPYLKHIRKVIEQTNQTLMLLPDKASRDAYMRNFEKRIYKENEESFKELTLNQGKLIIRLLDRETSSTSYELIRAYRGSFSAGLWQMFAVVLGADLKSRFGTKDEDAVIERVINLVEAGQL